MRRSTTILALTIGAVTCFALTACDNSQGGAGSAAVTGVAGTGAAGTRTSGAELRPSESRAVVTTRNGPGTGGGNQDGTGGGNQDGSGGGNNNGGNEGDGQADNPGGNGGDGSGDPVASASDGIPSIDFAEITCEDDDVNGLHPILRYAVSDAPGIGVNLNSEGNADQGGYHNYYTEYTDQTGAVPMPFEGCIAEYGESTYYLTTLGDEDTQDSRTITFTGDHHVEAAVEKPRIDEYVLDCTLNEDGIYDMTLYYSVANADGMALSIDNPGIVGSFGTYGPTDTIELPNLGCYAENGEQTYDLYTVGGTGPQAVVNLTRTGTATMDGADSGGSGDNSGADNSDGAGDNGDGAADNSDGAGDNGDGAADNSDGAGDGGGESADPAQDDQSADPGAEQAPASS
ncbi:hypothetical protein D1871_04055 [Nakamurella silvestris]|nr:hypothetical protein D1871_04055 [Nakamurella silvestris]